MYAQNLAKASLFGRSRRPTRPTRKIKNLKRHTQTKSTGSASAIKGSRLKRNVFESAYSQKQTATIFGSSLK
jgi:hypothetical protein